MKFLKTVTLPDDDATLRRICSVLQPGQWVYFPDTFDKKHLPPKFGIARFAGITKRSKTVVMDYTRRHLKECIAYAKS
jgi:hypothetical protein